MDPTIDATRDLIERMMEATGLDATGLARRAGLAASTLTRFMYNNDLGHTLSARTLAKLHAATGVPVTVPVPAQASVPVVGYVGAGEEVFPFEEDDLGGLEQVPAPPGSEDGLLAVIVRGNSMIPAFWEGDMLFYSQPDGLDRAECLYKECVVRLVDGHRYVKHVMPGRTPDTFTLMSFNAAPIIDVEIEWASPVQFHDMRRRNVRTEMKALTRPAAARPKRGKRVQMRQRQIDLKT